VIKLEDDVKQIMDYLLREGAFNEDDKVTKEDITENKGNLGPLVEILADDSGDYFRVFEKTRVLSSCVLTPVDDSKYHEGRFEGDETDPKITHNYNLGVTGLWLIGTDDNIESKLMYKTNPAFLAKIQEESIFYQHTEEYKAAPRIGTFTPSS